jgi:hypothetical protein
MSTKNAPPAQPPGPNSKRVAIAIVIIAACAAGAYFGNRWLSDSGPVTDPKVKAAEENLEKINKSMAETAPPPPPEIERNPRRGAVEAPKK